jgi:hypothetical protein
MRLDEALLADENLVVLAEKQRALFLVLEARALILIECLRLRNYHVCEREVLGDVWDVQVLVLLAVNHTFYLLFLEVVHFSDTGFAESMSTLKTHGRSLVIVKLVKANWALKVYLFFKLRANVWVDILRARFYFCFHFLKISKQFLW